MQSIWIMLVLLAAGLCYAEEAKKAELEAIDHAKLLEMIESKQTLAVILEKIDKGDFQIKADSKNLMAINKACNNANWTRDDKDSLMLCVMKKYDLKRHDPKPNEPPVFIGE